MCTLAEILMSYALSNRPAAAAIFPPTSSVYTYEVTATASVRVKTDEADILVQDFSFRDKMFFPLRTRCG